jgi:hypothetical protein
LRTLIEALLMVMSQCSNALAYCLRWVVANDEAAARHKAEARFPGQQFALRQVQAFAIRAVCTTYVPLIHQLTSHQGA